MASIRVAKSPQLLAIIFEQLEPPVSSPSKELSDVENALQTELRGTLFRAACASRALSEHALAALWRRLDDVRPLLTLFPQFQPCRHSWSEVSMLRDDITAEAWLRFQAYARRVRVLHQRTWAHIHTSTWSFLCRWCGPRPLLPNLEALSTLPIHVSDPVMAMLITPTLRSLRVKCLFDREWCTEDFDVVATLILRISKTAPHITELHFIHDDVYKTVSSTYLHPLGNFMALQVFEAENAVLDLHILRSLAKLGGLHTLSAIIDLGDVAERDPLDLFEETDWAALTRLSARGDPHHLATFVLNIRCYPPAMRSLTLEVLEERWPAALTSLMADCIGSFEFEGDDIPIEEFTLRHKHEFPRIDESFTEESEHKDSLLDMAHCLLRCSQLQKVTLDLTELPALTDADLERMIEAWPKLIELHIPPSEREIFYVHTSREVPRPTMSSLIAFARRCPRLRELSLPEINLSTLPKQQDWPFLNHPLQVLLVSFDRNRDNCLRAAEFIDRLFPCVRLRDPPPRESFRSYGRCDQYSGTVREYLEAIQIGRGRRELLKKLPRTDPRAGQATPVSW